MTVGPFAHSGTPEDQSDWQTLVDHSQETGRLAANQGAQIGLERVAGLDEAQSLPRDLLLPTLRMSDTLAALYGCSIVLCAATQPAFDSRQLKQGLPQEGRELPPIRRRWPTACAAPESCRAAGWTMPQGMVIVNSRKHALELYQAVQASGLEGAVHLTTSHYPAHRRRIQAGIWARLTGREDPSSIPFPDPSTSVSTMDVQATTVVLGGPGVAALLGGMPGAANSGAAPGRMGGGLAGPADVQSQVWSFFAGKGLQPHQIAAIMGNVSAESAFDPHAVGDSGTSFGLFQHHASRGQGLLSAVGGQAGLGNIEGQLEYVWKKLLTSESGVLKRLMGTTNVQDARTLADGLPAVVVAGRAAIAKDPRRQQLPGLKVLGPLGLQRHQL